MRKNHENQTQFNCAAPQWKASDQQCCPGRRPPPSVWPAWRLPASTRGECWAATVQFRCPASLTWIWLPTTGCHLAGSHLGRKGKQNRMQRWVPAERHSYEGLTNTSSCVIVRACTRVAVEIEAGSLCLRLQVLKAARHDKLHPAVEDGRAALVVQLQVGRGTFSHQGLKDQRGADSYLSLISECWSASGF